MTSLNTDRDVTWNTKYPPRKINGVLYKKGHSGLLPGKTNVDFHEEMWNNRGYKTKVELVFLHEKGDKQVQHPVAHYGKQWLTPGKAMYIVWRSAVKKSVKK